MYRGMLPKRRVHFECYDGVGEIQGLLLAKMPANVADPLDPLRRLGREDKAVVCRRDHVEDQGHGNGNTKPSFCRILGAELELQVRLLKCTRAILCEIVMPHRAVSLLGRSPPVWDNGQLGRKVPLD